MSSFAFSSFWFGSHVRVGSSARQPSPFSLLRQRNGTKRKATPLTGRLEADCPALLGQDGKGLNSPPGTGTQTTPLLVRLALRCSAVPKGPKSNTSSLRRCKASRVALAIQPVGAGEERRAGRDQKGRLSESRTRGEFEPLPRPDRAPQRTPRSGASHPNPGAGRPADLLAQKVESSEFDTLVSPVQREHTGIQISPGR